LRCKLAFDRLVAREQRIQFLLRKHRHPDSAHRGHG
jgi:hypothetical protein